MARPRITFAGPLPPPQHGMAAVNAEMVALLKDAADLTVAPVRPRAHGRGLAYHLTKSASALRAIVTILTTRIGGTRILYLSADDGLGGVWTLAFVAVARATGMRIFLHHHSYRYIVTRTRLMGTMVAMMGPHNVHVLLCDEMADDFSTVYPAARALLVAPNAVPEPVSMPIEDNAGAPLTLGMLSNLTFEKGIVEFVRILEALLARGLDVRGILAGPAVTQKVERFLRAKTVTLDGRLEWIGAVQDDAKERFFAMIDVFVFPTQYRTEALPLVLMEALVRGRPVIAPARGGIASYARNRAAIIVPLDADIVNATVEALAQLAADRHRLDELKVVARQDGKAMNAANREHRHALIQTLTASGSSRARSMR